MVVVGLTWFSCSLRYWFSFGCCFGFVVLLVAVWFALDGGFLVASGLV